MLGSAITEYDSTTERPPIRLDLGTQVTQAIAANGGTTPAVIPVSFNGRVGTFTPSSAVTTRNTLLLRDAGEGTSITVDRL